MDASIEHLFDAVAKGYDRQRKQLIPCFDEFYGMALSLAETTNPFPKILDLGAGTGLFSIMLLQKYPHAELTLIDLSSKMLEEARIRFKEHPNVQYVLGDYAAHPFTGHFDMIISSLSIHHLTHPAKQQLFARIYELLDEGGIFINADQVAGNTASLDAYYRKRWLEYLQQGTLSQSEIDAAIERRKIDINAKLSDQINWMKQAGLADVDCLYKYLDFAVFCGRKVLKHS
jgi:tRNA (cmo5U34)-methyltransferase